MQISLTKRKELVEALRVRCIGAAFGERIKVLDEFVALTGFITANMRSRCCAQRLRRQALRRHGIVSTTRRFGRR